MILDCLATYVNAEKNFCDDKEKLNFTFRYNILQKGQIDENDLHDTALKQLELIKMCYGLNLTIDHEIILQVSNKTKITGFSEFIQENCDYVKENEFYIKIIG